MGGPENSGAKGPDMVLGGTKARFATESSARDDGGDDKKEALGTGELEGVTGGGGNLGEVGEDQHFVGREAWSREIIGNIGASNGASENVCVCG